MAKKRSTETYRLRDGNKTVYIGTSNDPERREEEHREEGKKFTKLEPTSRKMTEDGAKEKEADQLRTFRQGHKGKNPQYNKDSGG